MKPRLSIGIAVDQGQIRMAGVRDARVEWVLESDNDDSMDTSASLGTLLAQVPIRESRRAPVGVAIARPLAQLRVVEGLPSATDADNATSLVAGSPHLWFLTRLGGLATSAVSTASDDARMAAAYPRSTLDSIRLALDSRGLRPRFVTIASVAQSAAHGSSHFDVVGSDIQYSWQNDKHGELLIRPHDASHDASRDATDNSPEPAILAGLGERRHAFAAAVGAAMLAAAQMAVPFSVDSFARPRTAVPAWRSRAATAVLAGSLLLTLAARPGAIAFTAAQLAQAERRSADSDRSDSIAVSIADAESGLASLVARSGRRVSIISLLEALRRSLPPDVAITSFRLDSTEGVLTVLGPRIGTVTDRLAESGAFRAPRLLGAVTAESVGPRILERATIAFSLPLAETPR